MYVNHAAKFVCGMILKSFRLGDAGVVDHHVQPTKGVERGSDHGCSALLLGHRIVAGYGFPACRLDLVHDLIGGSR